MKQKNQNMRIAGFTLAVILGMVGLGFIPSFKIFGMDFGRVDILASLRADSSAEEAIADYTANFDLLAQELAIAEAHINEADTMADPIPVRYEWIVERAPKVRRERLHSKDMLPALQYIEHFEDFDTLATTRFDNFIAKLANGESVRIAFMGDSFVEGDILTCDLRQELQSRFGGRGAGFIPADIPFSTVRKTIKRTSSNWNTYSVMKPKEAPDAVRERLYISGYLAEGRAGATTRWQTTDAYTLLDSCTQARILLISRDTSRVEVVLGDTLRNEFMIAGDERVREIYVAGPVDDIRLRVLEGSVMCYGASMEANGGVTVDNFSVRSNNGHAIFGTSATVNRQVDEMLGYDLVVLQYGLNIMQQGQRVYAKYRDQVRDMIAYAESCFPNAAIVVVGVSDRWVKNAETNAYEPIGSVDALTSYQRAAADSCNVAFWNTSRVMQHLGGMPAFVSNNWAAKDYTHINYAGGKCVASAFADAICHRVLNYLFEREEAERIEAEQQAALEAELQRQRELELQESLRQQVDSVTPLIEAVGWSNNVNNTEENNEE